MGALGTVRIVGNGRTDGTKVLDAVTGEELRGVAAVKFEHSALRSPSAELSVLCVGIDLTTGGQFMVAHPVTGEVKRVKRIEFKDGTEFVA